MTNVQHLYMPPRILVCAENPVEALNIESSLSGFGYQDIRVTSDAREIAPLYARWPFTLLILDMNAKTLSPFLVLESLRDAIASHKISVLALTAQGDDLLQDRAMAMGAAGVFARPLDRDETVMQVGYALDRLKAA